MNTAVGIKFVLSTIDNDEPLSPSPEEDKNKSEPDKKEPEKKPFPWGKFVLRIVWTVFRLLLTLWAVRNWCRDYNGCTKDKGINKLNFLILLLAVHFPGLFLLGNGAKNLLQNK